MRGNIDSNVIRFVHLSDIHYRALYTSEEFAPQMRRSSPVFSVRDCLEQEKKAGLNFVLVTGDLTHEGTESDFRTLRDELDELMGGIPLIALPGNHDPRDAYAKGFLRGGETDGMTFIDGLRVVTLDSGDSLTGRISKAQTDWLREVLREKAPKGTLLALHHTLVVNQDAFGCARYEEDFPLLIAQSDVLGIFCGHTHQNYAGQFAHKPYFTADSMAFSVAEQQGIITFVRRAAYSFVTLCDGIFSVRVKQAAA